MWSNDSPIFVEDSSMSSGTKRELENYDHIQSTDEFQSKRTKSQECLWALTNMTMDTMSMSSAGMGASLQAAIQHFNQAEDNFHKISTSMMEKIPPLMSPFAIQYEVLKESHEQWVFLVKAAYESIDICFEGSPDTHQEAFTASHELAYSIALVSKNLLEANSPDLLDYLRALNSIFQHACDDLRELTIPCMNPFSSNPFTKKCVENNQSMDLENT